MLKHPKSTLFPFSSKNTELTFKSSSTGDVSRKIILELLAKGLLTEKVDRHRSFFKTSAAGYEVFKQWRQLAAVVGA